MNRIHGAPDCQAQGGFRITEEDVARRLLHPQGQLPLIHRHAAALTAHLDDGDLIAGYGQRDCPRRGIGPQRQGCLLLVAEQQAEVARLTQKIEAMKEEIDELKTNLSKEMKEKNYYKNRFKEEEAEKELIIQENAGLKKDIEYLKAEINSLKAQLGIPV